MPPGADGAAMPAMPNLQARCQYGATQTSVLITEWTASDKADFEALMQSGHGVAVAFSGCQMRVLPECQLGGGYLWQRTTPSTDYVQIANDADLYAKLPLGAASLGGELSRAGSLTVTTTVAGQDVLQGVGVEDLPNSQDCADATHIIQAVSMGAFVMTAGSQVSGGADVSAAGIGEVGGSASQTAQVIEAAGDTNACAQTGDNAPAGDCDSPIQVFLTPIPGRAPPPGPPGTIGVDFESQSPQARWDVYVNDQATCTTPCNWWVDPNRPVVMRTRDFPDQVQLERLDASQAPLQITAVPTAMGEQAAGITFTTLGGLGAAAGITLGSIGCFGNHPGMCTAGIITFLPTAVLTAASIWIILDAQPRAVVQPLFGDETIAGLHLSPTGVSGTF
jgi:hypothetical protein